MKKRLGIVQVRGIGDALIALPIAEYYSNMDVEVYFALDDRFCESFQYAAPYCKFIPVPHDSFNPDWGIHNEYWFELPVDLLYKNGCNGILSFPYHESHLLASTKDQKVHDTLKHRFQGEFEKRVTELQLFQHLKFDEYKYATARVPFEYKWKLNIKRDLKREQELYDKLINNDKKYVVTHLEGSDIKYNPDGIGIDRDKYDVINITSEQTTNIFDWLTIIERADSVICLDSVFCNLIEQLNLPIKKHFIRRSAIYMTPVLKNNWEYVGVQAQYAWYK